MSTKHNVLRSLVPNRVRSSVRDLLGITDIRERIVVLEKRIDNFEQRLFESMDETWERSRTRWQQSKPDAGLTWGEQMVGDNFVSKVSSYGAFSRDRTILEIGPGYGRLLEACLRLEIPFKKYIGVDISIKNVEYLQENFSKPDIGFIHGDVEEESFCEEFDIVLSSLTLKHLFPSFAKALYNVASQMSPGGMLFFDLIEGRKRYFEDDGVTYIRWYTRPEILEMLADASLELVAIDCVRHTPDCSRLLVVARKQG